MKQIITFAAALSLAALPALGEESNESLEEGTEMLREGFSLLLDGLAEEMAPLAENMTEGWQGFVDELGDMSLYHAPEVLPNGDIIIRRKDPLADPVPEGEIEL